MIDVKRLRERAEKNVEQGCYQMIFEPASIVELLSRLEAAHEAKTKAEESELVAAQERDELAAHVERLNDKLGEIKDSLYGQNLHVAGWHLNGATEPMDTWFEDNDWEPEPVPLQQESLS